LTASKCHKTPAIMSGFARHARNQLTRMRGKMPWPSIKMPWPSM
jgi:hypothetical protein